MTHDETSTGVHVRRLRRRARPVFGGDTGNSREFIDVAVADAAALARERNTRPVRIATSVLDASALLKAEAIRSCRSFSHTPCGNSFARTFQQTGYFRGNVRVGENLFWGSGGLGTPASAVAAWLKSPPHRANLLGRGWRDVGVGMVYAQSILGASNVWIFVVQFGRRT